MSENRLNIDEKGLEELLGDALEQAKADLREAREHAERLLQRIEDPANKMGLDLYSNLYLDALKVKGAARERYLKIVSMVKDRLRIKEGSAAQGKTSWLITPDQVQELIDQASEEVK